MRHHTLPFLVDFNPFVGEICCSCQAEIMRTLLTQKLMSAVGVGQTTAAEEGARNMSVRCEPQGSGGNTLPVPSGNDQQFANLNLVH